MSTIKTQLDITAADSPARRARPRLWLMVGLILGLAVVGTAAAVYILASYPLVRGYANHSYIPDGQYTEGVDVALEPTDKAVESKLWHHAGTWWAVMWNPEARAYHIYRLNISAQEWVDTGVFVDDRLNSRSDVLWDEANNKLYIATHRKQENPSNVNNNPQNWAYLQQYHYAGNTWVADDNGIGDGTGVIADYITEALVIDQDTEGHMWATYTVRRDVAGVSQYYVAVSVSQQNNYSQWTPPVILDSLPGDIGQIDIDDISGLVAFEDADGPKMGVLWSNQRTDEFYFIWRNDTDAIGADWNVDSGFEALKSSLPPITADDHMNFAVTPDGDVLAIVKTGANLDPENEDTLIGIFARDHADGSWSWHAVSPSDSFDTRPLVLYNESNNTVYAYSVSSTGGGSICYQTAVLPADITAMQFPPGGCDPSDPFSSEVLFIAHWSGGLENISNPTSTKQNITADTGMVVLASDDVNGYLYVHNMEGGGAPTQPPAATPTVVPGQTETDSYLPFFANN